MTNKHMLAFSEMIMRTLKISFFFLIVNIPTYFLVMNLLFVNSFREIHTIVMSLLVLVPILIFPSIYAANAMLRKLIIPEKINFKRIAKDLKQNYLKVAISGLIYAFLTGSLLLATEYFFLQNNALYLFFLFLFWVITLYFMVVLSYMSDREERFVDYFVIAFFLLIQSPIIILTTFLSSVISLLLLAKFATPLLIFYMGYLICTTFDTYQKSVNKNQG